MTFTTKHLQIAPLGFLALALSLPSTSFAAPIIISFGGTASPTAGVVSSVPGVTTVNFDGGTAPGYYTVTPNAMVVSGNSSNTYAAPTGDSTAYLSTGTSNVVITPTSAYNYFGLYWGSLDSYNTISFKEADGSTTSYTGSQIAALDGISGAGTASVYVNFYVPTSTFTMITLSSSQFAFESDNHAFGNETPEPSTWAMVAGGIGLVAFARRRKTATASL